MDRRRPRYHRSIDLGIKIYSEHVARTVFLPVTSLEAPVIVSTYSRRGRFIVSMSCDREGKEPEYSMSAEEYQGIREDEASDLEPDLDEGGGEEGGEEEE